MCEARVKIFKKLLISSTAMFLAVPALPGLADSFESQSSDKSNKGFLVAQNTESDSDTLKITVTGTRSERPVETFPGNVDVLYPEDLGAQNSFDTLNILDDIPGVSFQETYQGKTGYQNAYDGGTINIRGVDGNRILMMIDGIRLPETYSYEDYYLLGRSNYINFETLKAVEVFKGPASSLYGSDALGGLVYFRSLEPGDLLEEGKNNFFEIPVSYNSANDGLKESIKVASRISDNLSSLFIFTKENSSEYKVKTEDKYLDDITNEGNNIFANIEYQIDDTKKINFIGESINRESDTTISPANLAIIGSSYTKKKTNNKTLRDRVSLTYDYKSKNDLTFIDEFKTNIYTSYAKIEDNFDRTYSYYGPQDKNHDYYYKNDMYGIDIQLRSKMNNDNSHDLTYGVEYSNFDSSRLRTTLNNLTTAVEKIKDQPDTNIARLGLYIQDEFSYGNINFIAGIRYDDYELDATSDSAYEDGAAAGQSTPVAADNSSNAFSPSLVASYDWNKKLSTYLKYAKGFRAPSYTEINSSRNPAYYTTLSNPDLKAEKSDNYEIGLKYNSRKHQLAISSYFSDYNDFIEPYKCITVGGCSGYNPTYQSQNASNAEIWGTEISSVYFLNEERYGISLASSIAFAKGNNTTEDIPLDTVQPFEAKIAIRYDTKDDKWNHELATTFVGEPRVASGTTTFVPDSYATFDIKTSYKQSDRLALNVGLYNLADERYYNYQSVKSLASDVENLTRYSQPGRNIRAGFSFKF